MYNIKNSKNKTKVKTAVSLLVGIMIMPAIADASTYETTSKLNLRTGPSTSQESIVTIPKNANVEYLSESGAWYKVKYDNKEGYISNQYVSKSEKTEQASSTGDTSSAGEKYNTTANLNLREATSTSSKKLTTVPKGKNVSIISKHDGWYKIQFGDIQGYASSQYLKSGESTPSSKEEVTTPEASSARKKVVDTASSLNGKVTYFWGGKANKTGWDSNWGNPKEVTSQGDSTTGQVIPYGLDCSGFIDWSFKTAGLGKSFSKGGTAMQWTATHAIEESELKIGDIAFKQAPGSKGANHIGIYVGNNSNGEKLFIHSSSTQNGVAVTTDNVGQLSIYRRPNIFK